MIEERQILTEQAKEGYSKEKHLDFLRLPAKDIRPLKSFLSSEQLTLIEPEGPSDFISSTTEQLDILVHATVCCILYIIIAVRVHLLYSCVSLVLGEPTGARVDQTECIVLPHHT